MKNYFATTLNIYFATDQNHSDTVCKSSHTFLRPCQHQMWTLGPINSIWQLIPKMNHIIEDLEKLENIVTLSNIE